MRTFACKLAAGLAAAMMCGATAEGQSFVVTNYTFDTSASASPPAWGVWPNGAGSYISNGWNASDADNNPASGSMLITSTFTGANEQSVVWSGQSGDFNPPLNGAEITNFSCAIRFDPSSPTNATTDSFGSVAFYLNTLQHGAYPPTQIGGYYSIPASNTNWMFFSVPVSVGGSVYGITIQLETYGNALTGTSRMFVDDIQLTGGTNPPVYGTATVNWSDVHQRIDGFGASSAWNGNWTTNEADLLFSTNENISYQSNVYNGVGLSLLRNHIAYASTTSASDTPGTTETTIMQWAQERGARVWSTPWTPPAGFKSTHDIYDTNVATASGIDGGSYLGSGNNVTNQNYASQLANYVASMQKNYGVNIYAISVQNEPDANVTNYEACQWTAAQIHDFVTNLSPTLATKGASSTKIIVPESQVWSGNTALYLPTLNDPKTAADVGIIANHDYVPNNNVGDQTAPAALAVFGKTLWETEVAILTGSDSSIANGVYYAQRIYAYLTQAQANAYHYWWLVALNTGDNEGLLDTSAGVTKRLFAFGQYSRFVRPNFYRIGATSATSTLVSAYKDSASTAFAIVVVNTNTATDVIETFNLTNFTAASVTPWVTSGALSLAPQSTVSVTNYSFTYRVPAMSIVTFAGQGNTPPVFEATPNQTANAGVTLLATNTATDTDLPAQTLTYSASSPLPLNAQINSATGVFMWRPLVSQANTTNTIQIQATDNGSPNLSATNSFVVVVNAITNPAISSVNVTQGQISMAVNGPFGPDYTLLTSTDLVNWQALLTSNSPATPFTFVATNGASQTKFYKVEIGP
jgi:glucuronoarabinoxylan endo-1,4-beta-xylanase